MGGDLRTEHTVAASATSFAYSFATTVFFFDDLLSLLRGRDEALDCSGVNTAPGLGVPTKPPHRIRRITVCLPPRRICLKDDTGNVYEHGTMLCSTVVSRLCVTLRRVLDDSHFFFYEKVDSNPADDSPFHCARTCFQRHSQPVASAAR